MPEIIIEPPPVEELTCATLRVTKVVQGTAPAGTTFTVLVQWTPTDPDRRRVAAQELPEGHVPPFTTALTFSETGGTQDVLIAGLSSCTMSETPPPPECTLAGITPSTTEITGPDVFPVFVTNRCAPPAPAAAPAQAQAQAQGERTVAVRVVGAPRFTG